MSLYSTVSPPFTPFTIQEAAILPSRDWRDNAPAPSTPFLPSDPDRFAMTATYDPATMSAAHAESTERSLAAPASVILPLQYLAYDLPNQSGGSTSPSWPMVTQTSVTQPSSYAAVPELQGVSGPSPATFEDQWQSNNGFPMTGWSYLQGLRLGAAPGHW
ncbi:hypothetical protein LTR16_001431 [Cryomyces antarcticus]|uniref:Uncharacterized protein n=1 Tax=Cryomyces antarcticus TaxID=329879 RepID=A0ABR0LQ89_9PEZI|nr:hypothetical protein LTR16_001431 [Cryomyces antarcticus]